MTAFAIQNAENGSYLRKKLQCTEENVRINNKKGKIEDGIQKENSAHYHGGTIASVESPDGLVPAGSEILAEEIDRLRFYYDVKVCDLMRLDSSNIQPEEWSRIARCVFENRTHFDGIVITHGTDTMAYTASALSFMLRCIDLPVVLTGAQLPCRVRCPTPLIICGRRF